MSNSTWVTVFQSQEEYSAHIKKLILEDAGIEVKFVDQRDSSYNNFGYVYLHVPSEFAQEAERLLKEHG